MKLLKDRKKGITFQITNPQKVRFLVEPYIFNYLEAWFEAEWGVDFVNGLFTFIHDMNVLKNRAKTLDLKVWKPFGVLKTLFNVEYRDSKGRFKHKETIPIEMEIPDYLAVVLADMFVELRLHEKTNDNALKLSTFVQAIAKYLGCKRIVYSRI